MIMKIYWKMPDAVRPFYQKELAAYHQNWLKKDLATAWHHLERAHILGQPWAVEHSEVHLLMLQFGFRIKNWHEVLGQIPRLLVGGVKSFVGKIPTGNTGGADVPPLKKMNIPADLAEILNKPRA